MFTAMSPSSFARRPGRRTVALIAIASMASAPSAAQTRPGMIQGSIQGLLARDQAVFGIFSGEHSAAQGAVMARNRATDFVFYSLESGPFDLPTMQAYLAGMAEGAGRAGAHPLALRIPPIADAADSARSRVRRGLAAGAVSIVFPHVTAARDAALAVDAMGPDLWPGNPSGRLTAMLIVEDREGVANAREIASTPGISVLFAGPGDLRRAYERDMTAVENAIQTVLAACKEFNVPCGITAGVEDIAERLTQGFRVIIVTQPEALLVGKRAAGR